MTGSMGHNSGGRLLVVYDGRCAFCRQSIDAIRRRDVYSQLVYVARETPGLEEQYPQLRIGDFNTGIRLIDANGTLYIGSDAIHQIASRLPYFRWFAWMYRLPLIHGLTRRIYALVAANRMKLSQYCEGERLCEMGNDGLSNTRRISSE